MKDLKKEAEEAAREFIELSSPFYLTIDAVFECGYLAAAEKQSQQWISVDDRLPEGKNYICYSGGIVRKLYYGIDRVFYTSEGNIWKNEVTHCISCSSLLALPSSPLNTTEHE